MQFYDDLSPFYDQMISFETRFENERAIFKSILTKYPAKMIIDAGCGSGYHSSILASLGAEICGFDPAKKMLILAEENIKKRNLSANFFQADFLSFNKFLDKKYDAIYTLGNSFVHLLSSEDISKALKLFKSVLAPGGYVCIGIINYDKVLKLKQSLISKKNKNGKIFHRHYSFNEDTIIFNIDISENNQSQHFETELFPLQSTQLKNLATSAGFSKIELFGNMKLDKYVQFESDNICAFLKF